MKREKSAPLGDCFAHNRLEATHHNWLRAEAKADRPYVMLPDRSPEAQARGQEMAAQVRQELQNQAEASLDDAMGELRGLEVIWPVSPTTPISYLSWHELMFSRPFNRMKTVQMPYMDALSLDSAEQVQADSFVTWNARHFRSKTALPVWTHAEFLANA